MRTTILLYLVLILLHLLHSFEERYGSASFISNWFQDYSTYYSLEIIAFIAAVVIFILYLRKAKRSYYMSSAYSILMVIDGLYHIATFIFEGKYFGGGAGSITSIGLILVGFGLINSLRRNKLAYKSSNQVE